MGADLELIKYKKDKYGDSFTPLAEIWSDQTGVSLLPRDVAKMMKQLKETRMNNLIRSHINAKSPMHKIQLEDAIEDTQRDMDAYDWIAHNFQSYLEL